MMYGSCNPYGDYSQQAPYPAPYKGSLFVLIVVLFILLIIVGLSFV